MQLSLLLCPPLSTPPESRDAGTNFMYLAQILKTVWGNKESDGAESGTRRFYRASTPSVSQYDVILEKSP